ncbi:MAG TPA: alpha/beta fold hydrolase [Acidimicrobiales bacterium]|nr:alpha/beta fold hydrolase [Acidimicrobiales bacterium]
MIPAGAIRLLRLLAAVPDRRDDALAVVNGFFGDALDDQKSSLALPMTFRTGACEVSVDRAGLRRAFPEATGRIVLLVHGLMSTESVWGFPGDPKTNYGSLLERDHGVTPIGLRYNSGRHISTNGRELARMLHDLVAAWPVPVRDITLIGHSMGGLVIRSACYYASATRPWRDYAHLRRSWTSRVNRVVLIGVPNTGAPLEVFANWTSAALWSLPIPATRLLGLGLDVRSAGIRDLRFGSITDEDWLEKDPDARARPIPHRVAALRRAAYLIVAGGVTGDPTHPLAQVFGDAFVTASSASGTLGESADHVLFPGSTVRLFPRMNHIALAHRPEVYTEIDKWWPDRS